MLMGVESDGPGRAEGMPIGQMITSVTRFRLRGPEWLHPVSSRLLRIAHRVLVLGPRSERLRWRMEDRLLDWEDDPPPRRR
jgi:hypothetical protein